MTVKADFIDLVASKEIYELDEGKPILYKGYRYGFSNFYENQQIMPDSDYQSWLKNEIGFFFRLLFKNKFFVVTVGEHGLSIKKNSWRAVDVAIFRKEVFQLTNQYSKVPPEVVFEIDLKGDFDTPTKAKKDQKRKIKQLFDFGVKKIIWIHTDSKEIRVIRPDAEDTFGWTTDIPVIESVTINIQKIIDDYENSFDK
ncbi:MAG: hypothetical protein AAF960_11105 [Bacteroidota bacterium]